MVNNIIFAIYYKMDGKNYKILFTNDSLYKIKTVSKAYRVQI